jgi:DNA-binding transcriptional regulator YhcF (GntR family)
MEDEYITLQTIFDIVKNDAHPQTYLCSAREIILRQFCGWDVIQRHLQLLAEKEFVVVKQLDKIAISITQSGIDRVKSASSHHESLFGVADKITEA